jgi:hypothetical protein
MRSTPIAVCLIVLSSVVFAQGDRGTITGTVADPAGAVVAGAQVEGKNEETGAIYPATTTPAGIYTLSQLPVGTYEVSVTVPGFKKFVRQGLRVEVAQTLRADVGLEVGAASESVTVTGEASMLKTESADVSHNVTVQTLNELPMLGVGSAQAGSSGARNPNNVILLVPGTYYRANAEVKVNGAPSNTQSYVVEGLDASNQLLSVTPAQVQPSVDAIQEVAVQTSNYAAEYAGGGGYFNVTMRSGTNQYHGSVYDYAVNEVLNAGVPFPRPGEIARQRQRRHDFGWTIGGPASIPKLYNGHDRTFFFFNFEQYRETQNIGNIAQTVPIDAYRMGDFSGAMAAVGNRALTDPFNTLPLIQNEIFDPATRHTAANGLVVYDPFPMNYIDPVRFDPVARKVQDLIPHPNQSGFVNNYLPNYPSVRHTTIPAIKADEQIGANGHLSFYWSFTHTDSQYSPIYGNSDGLPDKITEARGTFIHSTVYRLNYDHTVSPTVLWHFSVGYQDNNFLDAAPILNFNALQELGLKGPTVNRNTPNFTGFCPANTVGGAIQCTSSAAGGMKNMGPANSGQVNQWLQKPAANTSTTWVKGSHTYKFGAGLGLQGIPAIQYQNTNGNFAFSTRQTAPPYLNDNLILGAGSVGFGYASFLLGLVDQVSIAPLSETRQGKKNVGLFAQDSWKVNRRLTLDYGLRWDYSTYPREQYGRGADFSPTTPNPNAGGMPGGWIFEGDGPGRCNCSFARVYPYAFGPRLGVAYQITPKTVLRAGWGIIYGGTSNTGVSGAATTTLTAPGQAREVMRLQDGIPISPTWPVFSPGLFPAVPGTVTLTLPAGAGGAQIGMLDPNEGRPPRQNQWSIGIQREISGNLVVEASYVGNRGVWWQSQTRFGAPPGSLSLGNINALTPTGLKGAGLDINNPADVALLTQPLSGMNVVGRGFKPPYAGFPTSQSLAQSLRPFPQLGNILLIRPPVGNTWYDSLQAKATKRYSHGVQFTGLFTWQKSLQEGIEPANDIYNNVFVRGANKWLSSLDQPLVFTLVASYNVPKLGGNKWLSYALREWQIGTLLTYASGLPIPAPAASTSPSLSNLLFQPSLANRVAGEPLFVNSTTHEPLDINCHCFDPNKTFVLNPKAWQNPPPGQFGTAAGFYSDYRFQRHPQESVNFGRTFRFKERYSLNLRVEFTNIFNRAYYNDPTANGFMTSPQTKNPTTGLNASGFGYINTSLSSIQFGQPRQGTIVARFQF